MFAVDLPGLPKLLAETQFLSGSPMAVANVPEFSEVHECLVSSGSLTPQETLVPIIDPEVSGDETGIASKAHDDGSATRQTPAPPVRARMWSIDGEDLEAAEVTPDFGTSGRDLPPETPKPQAAILLAPPVLPWAAAMDRFTAVSTVHAAQDPDGKVQFRSGAILEERNPLLENQTDPEVLPGSQRNPSDETVMLTVPEAVGLGERQSQENSGNSPADKNEVLLRTDDLLPASTPSPTLATTRGATGETAISHPSIPGFPAVHPVRQGNPLEAVPGLRNNWRQDGIVASTLNAKIELPTSGLPMPPGLGANVFHTLAPGSSMGAYGNRTPFAGEFRTDFLTSGHERAFDRVSDTTPEVSTRAKNQAHGAIRTDVHPSHPKAPFADTRVALEAESRGQSEARNPEGMAILRSMPSGPADAKAANAAFELRATSVIENRRRSEGTSRPETIFEAEGTSAEPKSDLRRGGSPGDPLDGFQPHDNPTVARRVHGEMTGQQVSANPIDVLQSAEFELGARPVEPVGPRATSLAQHSEFATQQPLPAIRQIVEIAGAATRGSVEVLLSPEELGRVRILVSGPESAMNIVISVERQDTMDLLRRHLELLAEEFAEAGFGDLRLELGQGSDRERSSDFFGDMGEETAVPEPSGPVRVVRHAVTEGVDLRL